MNSKSVNRGQHTLHDTDSTEHIKHQKRVRNCFKPTQGFFFLLFCLGLPLFPACRKGRIGTHQRWGLDTSRILHMPPGSSPGMGKQQAWGCGLSGGCKAVLPSDWGEKTTNGTISILILPARSVHTACGKRMQLWMVEVARDKMIKNSAWTHTGFHKPTWALSQIPVCPHAQPKHRGTKNEGLLQDHLSPFQILPQESRGMQKLPVVSRWGCGIFVQDPKAHWGCPRCKPPLGYAAQTGLLTTDGCIWKMNPSSLLRPPHPTTSLLNVTAGFRWRECPWGSTSHMKINPHNLLNPLSNLCHRVT